LEEIEMHLKSGRPLRELGRSPTHGIPAVRPIT
jgi:hypothetical protein